MGREKGEGARKACGEGRECGGRASGVKKGREKRYFLPPERGLPSREAQILKNLVLSGWMLVCPDFGRYLPNSIWTGPTCFYKALIFRVSKKGPATFELERNCELDFRDPLFSITFSIFEQKISACSGGPQSSIEMQLFLAFLLASRLGSSLSGGDMPRGSNLVTKCLRTHTIFEIVAHM